MAHDVLVPPLGQTTDTVILATWYRQAGDLVDRGEPLFAIETDKATLDIEAQATGILAKVTAQAGDVVTVLSTIGVIVQAGEEIDLKRASSPSVEHTALPLADVSLSGTRIAAENTPVLRSEDQRVFISPRAKRLATITGITWRGLVGTGPEGAIVERDVRKVLASATPAGGAKTPMAPGTNDVDPKVSFLPTLNGRLAVDVDISLLAAIRWRLNERSVVVTLFDIALFVISRAVDRHPEVCDESIGLLVNGANRFHVGMITDTAHKSLCTLSREIADVMSNTVDHIVNTQFAPAFIVADMGRFGIDVAGPFAFSGEATVLGIGRERTHRDGIHTLWLTLTYRSTRLTDWHAAQFMNTVVRLIEDPDLLF